MCPKLVLEPGLVSVIMPAYNCEGLLTESVDSVRQQTFATWELIIVDDASSDKTAAIAQGCSSADGRIRVVRLQKNAGVANARNVGMSVARGQYLAFLDSDDLWLPRKLELQTEFMKQHDIAFSFTSYRFVAIDGQVGGIVTAPDRVDYETLLKGNAIGCLTVMIDQEKVGPFMMPKVGHEDYVAWLQILKRGHEAWGLQEDLARYRTSSSSVSGNKKRGAAWTWSIYREIEKLPITKAAWCFANYSMKAMYKHFLNSNSCFPHSPLKQIQTKSESEAPASSSK